MRTSTRKYLVVTALGIAALGSLACALGISAAPAHAQLKVFDPTNYSQNLLTAARTLQQINNQIQSLQNETRMLSNQAKNLSRIDFPELRQLTGDLEAIDRLMAQAQGLDFGIDGLDARLERLFPQGVDAGIGAHQRVIDAKARLEAARAGFRRAIGVQSQLMANLKADAEALDRIVGRSQGAEGALQAQQAANQLLALTAKQQFQIQTLMAAQYRAEATDAARRAQAEAEGQAATSKFLGSGSAYTPD
ncbi:P-type conjugative transfer protein TrbJ [Sphingosinicella sp. BN140058]|uniref:P-type conjugative transfer protein TrbJ n=1 Tax=Sphingosinicella sp. BN140058 TaxID=1892855 RepID=UPI001012EF08|nr:P-type conjugative transfer protein TrbJ [Sphingosinicella sp. BN140058]QAY78177.1 P-type conjugative transfer protein TrbJ [Sphingosinicella sp. BN140058]